MSGATDARMSTGLTFASTGGVGTCDAEFRFWLNELAEGLPDGATAAELGAGATPLALDIPRVKTGAINYYRIDISEDELAKSNQIGTPLVADVARWDAELPNNVDLAYSRMVAEHVADGQQLYRNVRRMLSPDGVYLQLAPTLGALPFVVNRILPEAIAASILRASKPERATQRAKFPARYSWCRGPTESHLKRIEAEGLEVIAARGYFGHGYYRRLHLLHAAELRKAKWLVEHPHPAFCSFTLLLLRRSPGAGDLPKRTKSFGES